MSRDSFRALVEKRLTEMGYSPRSFTWGGPSKLLVIINGEFRELPLRANMKREQLQFQLGRLAGWADILNLRVAA